VQRFGFWLGAAAFFAIMVSDPPAGLGVAGWRTAAVAALMAAWWFTEAVPVTLTGSLPFLLLPLLGVAKAEAVASQYMSTVLFLVLGGALIGLAFEKWDLHRRVALLVIRRTSPAPHLLLLAVLCVTAFVSMWVNNSAATVMMLPIATAVLMAATRMHGGPEATPDTRNFAACIVLAVSIGSNIGGFSTPIGTPVNAVALGVLEKTLGVRISFAEWMAFGLPIMLVALPIAWLLLSRVALPFRLPAASAAEVSAAIGEPGPIAAPQRRVIAIAALTSAAWIGLPWLTAWNPGITDAGVAVAGALALCVMPSGDRSASPRGRLLLEWADARQAPWYLILLLGGGLALADAVVKSGLSGWISQSMTGLSALSLVMLLLLVALLCVLVTECASNVATATTFMPIAATIAIAGGYDPVPVALAAGLAASWGFANPAGMSSNAMVFATGRVRIPEMVRSGLLIDALGVLLIASACAWIVPALDLGRAGP
jgi:sodium-dependent dicarboxylate transporter 2/3/5